MARGRPVVVIQVACALAWFMAGSQVAFGQTGRDPPSIRLSLSGINVLGLVTTTPAAADLSRGGASVDLPGVSVSGAATATPASVDASRRGISVVLPGAKVSGLATVSAATIDLTGKGVTIALPNAEAVGVSVVSTPLNLNLTGHGPLLDLAALTVGIPGQQPLTLLDSTTLEGVINQISPIAQMFASMGSAEALAPVEQLLNGFAFGDDASSTCVDGDLSGFAPLTASDISMWNAASVSSTEHAGFQVNSDSAACGSTLPFQTLQRAQLPGVLWDASSALGLKKGTFHLGLSGGAMEADTRIKSSAALRDAGITQGGIAKLTSWSVGAFSLLTTDNWYAGSAIGGAWGRTESQNFVLGSTSDFNASSVIVAGFVGTIVPLAETARFDLRGTLSFQRTVGEAHVDSIGISYGEHAIEAANAMLSGRLFGVFRQGGLTVRPFLQAGITHRLHYDNRLDIDGAAFTLQEADTSLFAASGLDFEINKALQLSVGVRHDHSEDQETLTGRLGFSARLN